MSLRTNDYSGWVTYPRSFVLTLGGLFLGLVAWVWTKDGERRAEWPLFAWCLFLGAAALGLVLLVVGFAASNKTVEHWADKGSTHEASIFVMLIAAPVYFFLKLLIRRK